MRVLVHEWVTGGGLAGRPIPDGLGREGGAMRRAAIRDLGAVPGVEVVATRDDRFIEDEDAGPVETVAVAPGREESALAALAGASEWTLLIAPETGAVLRDRAALVGHSGGRLLGPGPAAIDLAADKRRFARHLRDRGIPTPEALPLDRLDPSAGPVVVKPTDGAGCVETRVLTDPADLDACRDLDPSRWLAQPFVAGAPLSASYLVGPAGAVALVGVGRQRIRRGDDGALAYEGGELPAPRGPGLGPPLDAVRSVPGLLGFVGVDFVHDPETGAAWVLDLNPRLTTSFVGWQSVLGVGVLARAWLSALGLIPTAPAPDFEAAAARPRIAFDADGRASPRGGETA